MIFYKKKERRIRIHLSNSVFVDLG